MEKKKKSKAAFNIVVVLILVWEAYFKNWVSKVLSFYLEQTTHLRKFL